MADWQRKLRLQPEWGMAQEGEIEISELAAVLAKRLRALEPFHGVNMTTMDLDDERQDLADEFEALAADPDAGTAEVDSVMERLYNWGDTSLGGNWPGRKACWVDTMTMPETASAEGT